MDNEKKEHIIKDLLYENATREMLEALDKKKKSNLYIIRTLAAVFVLGIAYFGFIMVQGNGIERSSLVASAYTFPTVSKSRSELSNQIDSYILDINNKEYKKVLSSLYNDSLTMEDKFIKANLLFALDSLDIAADMIRSTSWTDPYHLDETAWLDFLIAVKKGESAKNLKLRMQELPSKYQEKGHQILKELQ